MQGAASRCKFAGDAAKTTLFSDAKVFLTHLSREAMPIFETVSLSVAH
jgi:hypothetical protein